MLECSDQDSSRALDAGSYVGEPGTFASLIRKGDLLFQDRPIVAEKAFAFRIPEGHTKKLKLFICNFDPEDHLDDLEEEQKVKAIPCKLEFIILEYE